MSLVHSDLPQLNTAFAEGAAINTSRYKLGLVATLVRGMNAAKALLQLQFCNKKVARYIAEVLKSAIANAENNCALDIDRLYISKILVNHAFYLKRLEPKARGRAGKIRRPFSKIRVFVTEKSS